MAGTGVVVGTGVGVIAGVDLGVEGASRVVGVGEAGGSVAAGNVGAVDGLAQAPTKIMPVIRIAKSGFVFIAIILEFLFSLVRVNSFFKQYTGGEGGSHRAVY